MPDRPPRHQRRSIRLPVYDYTAAGAYFVTICTYQRRLLFGDVVDDDMVPNTLGGVIDEEWTRTAVLRPYVDLDAFVIMPNHIHGILWITDDHRRKGAPPCAPTKPPKLHRPPRSLGSIIAGFKAAATKRINQIWQTPGEPVWQRNYYEHVIRDEPALNAIRQYIQTNPARWAADNYHPANR